MSWWQGILGSFLAGPAVHLGKVRAHPSVGRDAPLGGNPWKHSSGLAPSPTISVRCPGVTVRRPARHSPAISPLATSSQLGGHPDQEGHSGTDTWFPCPQAPGPFQQVVQGALPAALPHRPSPGSPLIPALFSNNPSTSLGYWVTWVLLPQKKSNALPSSAPGPGCPLCSHSLPFQASLHIPPPPTSSSGPSRLLPSHPPWHPRPLLALHCPPPSLRGVLWRIRGCQGILAFLALPAKYTSRRVREGNATDQLTLSPPAATRGPPWRGGPSGGGVCKEPLPRLS